MYVYIHTHKYIYSFTDTKSREIFSITTFMKIKTYILFRALTLFLHFHLSKPRFEVTFCVCGGGGDVDCLEDYKTCLFTCFTLTNK